MQNIRTLVHGNIRVEIIMIKLSFSERPLDFSWNGQSQWPRETISFNRQKCQQFYDPYHLKSDCGRKSNVSLHQIEVHNELTTT